MPRKQAFKGVKRVRRHNGTVQFYHRATQTRLPDEYGSHAFIAAWLDCEKRLVAIEAPKPARDTYAGLWQAFEASPDWQKLKPRTQEDYARVRDWMYAQNAERKAASAMEQRHAEKLYDKALSETYDRFALHVLQANRRLFNWVLERSARTAIWGERNPWANIRHKPSGKQKPHRPWTPTEIAEVLTRAPMGLARAYVLGLSGFDGAHAYEIRWADYQNGRFSGDRVKTGVAGESIVPVAFRPWLDRGPRPSEWILTNADGKRWETLNSFQTASSRFLGGLAKDGVVSKGLTFHGLRHTVGKAIAESGGGLAAIQSALRHKTERMALHYSKEADKAAALEGIQDALQSWFLAQPDTPDWHSEQDKPEKPNGNSV